MNNAYTVYEKTSKAVLLPTRVKLFSIVSTIQDTAVILKQEGAVALQDKTMTCDL